MKLSATLSKDELRSLAHSLIPLRLDLSEGPDKPTRWLDIEEILDSEMLVDEGFSLTTRVSIRWPERNLMSEFGVERLEVLVQPKLVSNPEGVGLVVTLRCRDLDIRWVPDFIDQAIVKRINQTLAETEAVFDWNFSEALSATFTETGERSNIASIGLDVSSAKLEIDNKSVYITGPMQFLIDRRAPEAIERESLVALPEQGASSEQASSSPE